MEKHLPPTHGPPSHVPPPHLSLLTHSCMWICIGIFLDAHWLGEQLGTLASPTAGSVLAAGTVHRKPHCAGVCPGWRQGGRGEAAGPGGSSFKEPEDEHLFPS